MLYQVINKNEKLKTDVVPNGLVNKLDISIEEIKQDIIDKIGQSDGGNLAVVIPYFLVVEKIQVVN